MEKICPLMSYRLGHNCVGGVGRIECIEEECGCWNKEYKKCGLIVR